MTQASPIDQVRRLLRIWGAIRIGYGALALFAPELLAKLLRVDSSADTRGFNAFLGSRDIVIGAYSLAAGSEARVTDAVALNQACEAVDTVVLTQELRAGRGADLFSVAGFGFNAFGTLTWLRARMLMKNRRDAPRAGGRFS
jgi:hypothetical protein